MARHYTFEQWLLVNNDEREAIDSHEPCDGLGLVACPECLGEKMEDIRCEKCNDNGQVDCTCVVEARSRYSQQCIADDLRLEKALRAVA